MTTSWIYKYPPEKSMNDTSEPAFPVHGHMYGDRLGGQLFHGMTLRDYFAAKAMQSMNAREDYMDAPANVIALDAYELADAMLKARKQP